VLDFPWDFREKIKAGLKWVIFPGYFHLQSGVPFGRYGLYLAPLMIKNQIPSVKGFSFCE
jgi:hypothetical protein